jgi:glycosyltransferase involved in cell wall biosynthesis
VRVTVFTPTYNGAHTLERAYRSLCAQTFREFEWLVIDDGSTDRTGELIRGWMRSSDFPLRYVRQQNSGKHVATNRALDLAAGDFFATLDADDWYSDDALERFLFHWQNIPQESRSRFVGVVALCADQWGEVIGGRFPQDVIDSDFLEIQVKYGVTGDKAGIGRTDVNREFPFPELEQGGWVPEALVYNRMARRYKARFVNEVLRFTEYQPGGITASGGIGRVKSPLTARLYYQECLELGSTFPLSHRLRHQANFVRFSLHAGARHEDGPLVPVPRILRLLSYPLGVGLYLRDRLALRRRGRAASA